MKLLTRQASLVEEMDQTCLAEPDVDCEEACNLRPLQAAAVSYRIAFGPCAGQMVLSSASGWNYGAATSSGLRFLTNAAAQCDGEGGVEGRNAAVR